MEELRKPDFNFLSKKLWDEFADRYPEAAGFLSGSLIVLEYKHAVDTVKRIEKEDPNLKYEVNCN